MRESSLGSAQAFRIQRRKRPGRQYPVQDRHRRPPPPTASHRRPPQPTAAHRSPPQPTVAHRCPPQPWLLLFLVPLAAPAGSPGWLSWRIPRPQRFSRRPRLLRPSPHPSRSHRLSQVPTLLRLPPASAGRPSFHDYPPTRPPTRPPHPRESLRVHPREIVPNKSWACLCRRCHRFAARGGVLRVHPREIAPNASFYLSV